MVFRWKSGCVFWGRDVDTEIFSGQVPVTQNKLSYSFFMFDEADLWVSGGSSAFGILALLSLILKHAFLQNIQNFPIHLNSVIAMAQLLSWKAFPCLHSIVSK